jgi:hypothetical protein
VSAAAARTGAALMLKPASLRAALVAALPDYARDPDRLVIFAEKGRIATRPTAAGAPANFNFEYRYDLRVTLLDYSGHTDLVMLPVLQWLAVNQPDLLQARATANEAIAFEAEFLSQEAADLELTLRLTEAVRIERREDGGTDLRHLEEPALVDPPLAESAVLRELGINP